MWWNLEGTRGGEMEGRGLDAIVLMCLCIVNGVEVFYFFKIILVEVKVQSFASDLIFYLETTLDIMMTL